MSRLVNRNRTTGQYYYLGSEQDMLAKMYDLEKFSEKQYAEYVTEIEDMNYFSCPQCQKIIIEKQLYCDKCGQSIKWD